MTRLEFEKRISKIEDRLASDISRTTGVELKTEVCSRNGKIYMEKDGHPMFGHCVNFYYRSRGGWLGKNEKLEFNMGTMGNFQPSDTVSKMYIALGIILSDNSLHDEIVNSVMEYRKLELEYLKIEKEYEEGKEVSHE